LSDSFSHDQATNLRAFLVESGLDICSGDRPLHPATFHEDVDQSIGRDDRCLDPASWWPDARFLIASALRCPPGPPVVAHGRTGWHRPRCGPSLIPRHCRLLPRLAAVGDELGDRFEVL